MISHNKYMLKHTFGDLPMHKYYSQIGQDQYFIENIAKGKKNGVFLDIGANDGIHTSNTAALEFDHGWTGILVEANPSLAVKCQLNRPASTVLNYAVWNSDTTVQLEIPLNDLWITPATPFDDLPNPEGSVIEGHLLSRITGIERNRDCSSEHFSQQTETVPVEARTVTSILKQLNRLPCTIDYCSIDTEGAEFEALEGIDFGAVDIRFLTIEHGLRPGYKEQFAAYLAPYGFTVHRVNKWDIEFTK